MFFQLIRQNLIHLKRNSKYVYGMLFNSYKPIVQHKSLFNSTHFKKPNQFNQSKKALIFILGITGFLIKETFLSLNSFKVLAKSSHDDGDNDEKDDVDLMNTKISIDLNEIYEKCAVIFLSNQELHASLGIPIKITSNSELDDVRSLSLRREGKELFAFLAYDLEGSINSGIIYCKVKLDIKTHKFQMESILLKLSKPDKNHRNEILIMNKSKNSN